MTSFSIKRWVRWRSPVKSLLSVKLLKKKKNKMFLSSSTYKFLVFISNNLRRQVETKAIVLY
jgi:hypothetical protein